MARTLRDLVSREPVELPLGVEKVLRFCGVVVKDLRTGKEVEVKGPVDLNAYGPIEMELTDPRTGRKKRVPGIRLIVCEEDGQPVRKPLNVVSKRFIEQLLPDLEDGSYMRYYYHIVKIGKAPKTWYQIKRVPIPSG